MAPQSSGPEHTPLIEAPKSKLPAIIGGLVALVVVVGLVVFFTTRGGDDTAADGTKLTKVTVGIVDSGDAYWKTYQEEARKQGIEIVYKKFSDYDQPNPALSQGEVDVNEFQHIIFLAAYNVKNHDDLVPLGSTATYPLGLYSTKYTSVDDIKDGETVVVPDDDTNQARALVLLQSKGLIKLKDGGTPFSTIADVDESASRVKVKALKADLTPTSLQDVAAAIINNDFVEDAGLKFSDAIATDDPSDPKALPYVNIFAVRAEDKDNPTYQKLVEIYQDSKAVQAGADEASGHTAQFVKIPQAELQKSLEQTEKQVEAAQ